MNMSGGHLIYIPTVKETIVRKRVKNASIFSIDCNFNIVK